MLPQHAGNDWNVDMPYITKNATIPPGVVRWSKPAIGTQGVIGFTSEGKWGIVWQIKSFRYRLIEKRIFKNVSFYTFCKSYSCLNDMYLPHELNSTLGHRLIRNIEFVSPQKSINASLYPTQSKLNKFNENISKQRKIVKLINCYLAKECATVTVCTPCIRM